MVWQPTLFMRIHKTAGEALAKQISDRLLPNTICPEKFEYRVRALSPADLCRYSFFEGHISPSALSAVSTPLRVFTMLRSPKERLLSCFFYWKEGSIHTRSEFFEAMSSLTLLGFLRSENPIIRRATWNVQSRLLAGGRFGDIDGQRQNVFGPPLVGTDLAAEATRGLDRFGLVGIAERYEVTLRRAYALLELGDSPPPEFHNVTTIRPPNYDALLATSEIADALWPLVEADQPVYEAACRKLDRDPSASALDTRPRPPYNAVPSAIVG